MSILLALPSAFLPAVADSIRQAMPAETYISLATDRSEWLESLNSSTGALVNEVLLGNVALESHHLNAMPNLRHVQRWGSGTDNVDVVELAKRHITFASTPGANAGSVAEQFWALALAAARQIVEGAMLLRAGGWPQQRVVSGLRDINGATLGLVGYGRIGSRVGRIGVALGASVTYTTRSAQPRVHGAQLPRRTSLTNALQSDIVGIVCDLNPSTRHLIGAAALEVMRPDSLLVNVARGAIVDETALLAALNAGTGPAIYAADVMAKEPFAGELVRHPRVILSPHVAGRSPSALSAVTTRAIAGIIEARQRLTNDIRTQQQGTP
jgi:D-3-phosphoglycerate dehydrogenase